MRYQGALVMASIKAVFLNSQLDPLVAGASYKLFVQDKWRDGVLYQEQGLNGKEAAKVAVKWADEIRRIGVEEWVDRKTRRLPMPTTDSWPPPSSPPPTDPPAGRTRPTQLPTRIELSPIAGSERLSATQWGQTTVASWISHHGRVAARLARRRWWHGGVAFAVLVLIYGSCDVSDVSGSSAVVGTPTDPQILACYEEATQFTGGTLPPVGPDDIGFGVGYFPKARGLATMNPPNSGRDAQLSGYKLPPVVYPGATVTMTIASRARSYVVQQNPWSPRQGSVSVTYRACSHEPGFFPQSFRFTDGRIRGCVPLDVRVGEQRKVSHIVLSFFAGRCRTSS